MWEIRECTDLGLSAYSGYEAVMAFVLFAMGVRIHFRMFRLAGGQLADLDRRQFLKGSFLVMVPAPYALVTVFPTKIYIASIALLPIVFPIVLAIMIAFSLGIAYAAMLIANLISPAYGQFYGNRPIFHTSFVVMTFVMLMTWWRRGSERRKLHKRVHLIPWYRALFHFVVARISQCTHPRGRSLFGRTRTIKYRLSAPLERPSAWKVVILMFWRGLLAVVESIARLWQLAETRFYYVLASARQRLIKG